LLIEHPQWLTHLKTIYNDAFSGSTAIVISEICMAECCRLDAQGAKPLTPTESMRIISAFFHHPFLIRRAVTSRESELAAQFIRAHGFGTCDALIAATAILADATVLITSDGCTGRRKAGKLLTCDAVETTSGKKMLIRSPDQYNLATIP
jgi:predicted nucleic acid-binding protein